MEPYRKSKGRQSQPNFDRQKIAAQETKEFLNNTNCRNSLTAWLHCFDSDHNDKIDFSEFCQGMNALGFPGDVTELWKAMDADGSGELTFDEIDTENADMWASFRRWCGQTFTSSKDMIIKLNRSAGKSGKHLKKEDFCEQLPKFGWDGLVNYGSRLVEVLFDAMDSEGCGFLTVKELKWLDVEVKKQKRKEMAKSRAKKASARNLQQKMHSVRVLAEFKEFLNHQFGCLFRGWRKCLDLDGSMSVTKGELFKACVAIGFKGDARALWKALDADGSGCTSLEELDPDCAGVLAQFKNFGDQNYGNARAFFRAVDRHKLKRLKMAEFVDGCRHVGFMHNLRSLFQWFDWERKGFLTEDDLECLDVWRPCAWLIAEPNLDAAEEFKALILRKCKHMVKAWRVLLDRDNSNRVSWHEFESAAKKLHWRTDVPGAWLAFDEDCSGYITLKEIDPAAHDEFVTFKKWADSEFGSVATAFWVLDADQSMELSMREFCRAAREYGYHADASSLFKALDLDHTGRLSIDEVAFLDTWDLIESNDIRRWATVGVDGLVPMESSKANIERGKALLDYNSDVPGPGAYNVPGGLGHMPTMPTRRHGGAFSMGHAISAPWMEFTPKTKAKKPTIFQNSTPGLGPAAYSPTVKAVTKRKPGWGFGSASRFLTGQTERTPGPAAYDAKSHFQGPQISMVPRRRLELHPSQRQHKMREEMPLNHVVP